MTKEQLNRLRYLMSKEAFGMGSPPNAFIGKAKRGIKTIKTNPLLKRTWR